MSAGTTYETTREEHTLGVELGAVAQKIAHLYYGGYDDTEQTDPASLDNIAQIVGENTTDIARQSVQKLLKRADEMDPFPSRPDAITLSQICQLFHLLQHLVKERDYQLLVNTGAVEKLTEDEADCAIQAAEDEDIGTLKDDGLLIAPDE